jgi:hypothetical protein
MDLWTRVRLQSPNPSQPSFCANLTGVKKSPSPTLGASNFHIWASWNNQLYARRASKNIYRILTNLSIFTYLLIFIYRVWSWGNILGAKWAPYQINFGSPHNLLGAHQERLARLPPRLQGALRHKGSAEGPRKPWVKWCIILHSGHFLAAKVAIQKL